MTDKIDNTSCPLCHINNQCGVNNTTSCWCAVVKIPAALLAQVPSSFKGKVCICQACVDKFNRLSQHTPSSS